MRGCTCALLFRQAAGRIAAMAIGAAEHDIRGGMHRLDAIVALIAAGAFCVGLRPGFDRSNCAAEERRDG